MLLSPALILHPSYTIKGPLSHARHNGLVRVFQDRGSECRVKREINQSLVSASSIKRSLRSSIAVVAPNHITLFFLALKLDFNSTETQRVAYVVSPVTTVAARQESKHTMSERDHQAADQEVIRFECSICCDDKAEKNPIDIGGDKCCLECFNGADGLRQQFELYLKDETQPPTWGNVPVTIEMVAAHFPATFLRVYEEKMEEYATHPPDRCYCKCGCFLGTKTDHIRGRRCHECRDQVCMACGGHLDGPMHCCEKIEEEDPFKDLKRGRDYQLCPSCTLPVFLGEACNHMTCARGNCRQGFCYICGEKADGDSDHWSTGKPCPRWNQPGAADAQFDIPESTIEENLRLVAWHFAEDGLTDLAHDFEILFPGRGMGNFARHIAMPPPHHGERPGDALRQQDRRTLIQIAEEAMETLVATALDVWEPRPWESQVWGLAFWLMFNLDVYTFYRYPDIAMRAAWRDRFMEMGVEIDDRARAIPPEGYERWPQLEGIYNRYRFYLRQIAGDGGGDEGAGSTL